MDACVHKIEQQLRRYKEKVQNHKGDATLAGSSFERSDTPASREEAGSDRDEA